MTGTDRAALDTALIAAHDDGDPDRLSMLYENAARALDEAGDIDAACFFFTQALVFALEAGSPRAGTLRAELRAHGRV